MSALTLETVAERLEALERKVASLLAGGDDPPGTVGNEPSDDPRAVAAWIAAFDAIPPLQMTPEEEAAWRAARTAQHATDDAARAAHRGESRST